jgi:hypothetical protein
VRAGIESPVAGSRGSADTILSDSFATNGITAGPAGPKRNIENRLTGFSDLRTFTEEVIPLTTRS